MVRLFFCILMAVFSTQTFSMTPTKQQIEQFKSLPESQQIALAKQMGIDISAISSASGNTQDDSSLVPTVQPRVEEQTSLLSSDEQRYKPVENKLKPFGYDLFSGDPTTFMPSEISAVPDTYTVGRGDEFQINLYGKESLTHIVSVDREGRLSIPDLTPIYVAGLTFFEIKEMIKTKYAEETIGLKAFVSLGKLRSMRILVLGESYKPGSYNVSSLTTVSHALFISGGISNIGSLRNIQVKRSGKVVQNFDLYDLLIKGDSSGDIILKPGDVVFIPPVSKRVSVQGLVKRPAIFELKDNEQAAQLMKMAGGLLPSAYAKNAIVERFSSKSLKEILSVDLTLDNLTYKPKDGDVVTLKPMSEQISNSVALVGAVTRPGQYQWYQGQKVSDVIKSVQGDLLIQADLDYALVVREQNIQGNVKVLQINIANAIANKTSDNVLLQKNDRILVFSRYQLKVNEKVALNNLALTETQAFELEKTELWHQFENKQFYDFVGAKQLGATEAVEVTEATEKPEKIEVTDLNKLQLSNRKNLKLVDFSAFSREKLLKPLILQLKKQSGVNEKIKLVEVAGHVKFPGIYPLSEGASVKELVIAAGGLLESAYLAKAEVTRVLNNDTDTASVAHIGFDLKDAIAESASVKFALKSRDSLNIFAVPNWQENVKVELKGEVKFPGTYTIMRGETLVSLLERAGGFSDFAAPNAAIFTRESVRIKEQEQLAKLADELRKDIATKSFQSSVGSNSLSYVDTNNLLKDIGSVEAVGRLVIDLPEIVNGHRNLTLQNGDALYIPAQRESISVIGEVNLATSHLFTENTSIDDYIAQSGGLKSRAAESRIYVIKANGAVKIPKPAGWFSVSQDNFLEPGDTIVIPLDSDHMNNLTLWSTVTQIVYQLGVAVAAISSI